MPSPLSRLPSSLAVWAGALALRSGLEPQGQCRVSESRKSPCICLGERQRTLRPKEGATLPTARALKEELPDMLASSNCSGVREEASSQRESERCRDRILIPRLHCNFHNSSLCRESHMP